VAKSSWLGRLGAAVGKWWDELHIGDGHASGMGRLGLAELRQALSYGQGSVEQPTAMGVFGSPTQGEIADARNGPGKGPNQEGRSTLTLDDLRAFAAQKSKQPEQATEQQRHRDGPEMEH